MSAVHAATCATGARAEKRGACDCGAAAAIALPFRFRFVEQLEQNARGIPHRLVELEVDRALTTSEVLQLALELQDLTRVEGARAAAAAARKAGP